MKAAKQLVKDKIEMPISFLWSVIKPYKYFYLIMAVAPVCSGIYPVMCNYAVKLLIDLFTKFKHISFAQALLPVLYFILAEIILEGGWRLHNFAQLKSIPYIFQRMMDKICTHIFYLPYTYFQNNLAGTISGKIRGIGDSYYKMHQAVEFQLSKPLLVTIFSGITLAWVNLKIFTFVLSFTIVYSLLAVKFFTKLARLEQAKQDSWYYLFGTIADRIQNIANIFTFATRVNEIGKIQDYYRHTHNQLLTKYFKYDLIISIVLSSLYVALLILIFIFVIHLRNLGEITVGDIAFIVTLTFLFAENSWHTTMEIKSFLEAVAAFRSAFSIMQISKCEIDLPNAAELKVSQGEIIFKNVKFNYENSKNVFNNLNLRIIAGQKIGLVGHSGAGKSTLIALLLKNFKVTAGDIYIDQQSIYNIASDSLRANIALIPQDITLFHRSIGENIGYAKANSNHSEIENAAKMANIHGFIINLPEGYNTLVGERGIKLSGGQRQRIAIARAILKNSPILILDEATSSLDSQTESEIQRSINTILETNKATVIAIAHRLSTIKYMDRIVVFDGGKIVEDGNFSELIRLRHGKFKKLWEHQINGMVV